MSVGEEKGEGRDGQEKPAERRYDDDEIGAIFAKATESEPSVPPTRAPGAGLTLVELQEIGRQVGVDPSRVADAAAALAVRPVEHPRRQFLGFPVGVARTADLPQPLSNRDWERLVVELRETFDAHGSVRQEGSLRSWRNGNLQALVEPTETGERLRLRTVSSRLQAMLRAGSAGIGFGTLFLIIAGLSDTFTVSELAGVLTGFFGVGVWGLGVGALQSFRWARTRERQMEAIAQRAGQLAGGSDHAALPAAGGGESAAGESEST